MSDLPDGWALVKLGDVGEWGSGGTPTRTNFNYYSGGSIPWLVIGDLNDGYVRKAATRITEEGLRNSAAKLLPIGTVLIAMYGSIGKLGITDIECATNQAIAFCKPNLQIISLRYLFRTLFWAKPALLSLGQGGAQQNINQGVLRDFQIPLAPQAEQTRIADQLDKLLARIQSCNDRLDAIPALLKRFRQSILAAAISGKLTEEWRELNTPQPWRHTNVGALTQSSYYGPRFGKEEYTSLADGIPTIRTTDMDHVGKIHITSETPRVLVPKEKIEQFRVKAGDLLITRTGSIGVMAVFDGDYLAIPSAYLIRFRFNEEIRTRFAYFRLASPKGQAELGLSATAVTQPNVNAEAIKRISLELPSLAEQDEIIRSVDALYAVADRIEARYTAARVQAQRITPLLLAKAFRGELVQQDPQDEPASVLLERIAATPPAKIPTSRGRPRIKPEHQFPLPELKPADWSSLPDGAWGAPADPDGFATMVGVAAVLRAWGKPVPEREARLAALLCLQPRLFTTLLPVAEAKQWSRLIGDEARPLPAQVLFFQPAINGHWGRAIKGMRARGDLEEAGTGNDITWALGAGAASIETAGWPDGRAGFVVVYLRAHGTDSVLPLLEISAQEFANARAA